MRQKRAKAYRKLMSLYAMTFGFRQPYQVVVDSLMCKEAVAQKVELGKQLGNVLQGLVKPMITQCCIHELYLQGRAMQPAVDLAKTFERRKCNHREPIPGDECITSIVGDTNKHRYVIATQSQPLRQQLRQIPAVPIVHINRAVMVLEPPSDKTMSIKETTEEQRLLPTKPEQTTLHALEGEKAEAPKKKRKGPKGPNPLSVKKKQRKVDDRGGRPAQDEQKRNKQADVSSTGSKRRRPADDDDGGEGSGGPADRADDSTAVSTGHKRRRRRKKAGADGDGDDE